MGSDRARSREPARSWLRLRGSYHCKTLRQPPLLADSCKCYLLARICSMPANDTKRLSKAYSHTARSSERFAYHLCALMSAHGKADLVREKPGVSKEPEPLAQPIMPSLVLDAPSAQTLGSARAKRKQLPFIGMATLT